MTPGRRADDLLHEEHLGIVRRRTRAEHSAADIAAELRCHPRTVTRYRAELRKATPT